MATHYKGERIDTLLKRIEELKQVLDTGTYRLTPTELTVAYTDLAIAKAKFTALQGGAR